MTLPNLAQATLAGIIGFMATGFLLFFTPLHFNLTLPKKYVLVAGVVCVIVGLIFAACGFNYTPPVQLPDIPESTDIQIYSADLGSQLSGSFILGSGYVGSEEVYKIYEGDPITGLTRTHYPISKSTVFLDENKNPYIRVRWMRDPNTRNIQWNSYHYDFHLPSNAIIRKYDLN